MTEVPQDQPVAIAQQIEEQNINFQARWQQDKIITLRILVGFFLLSGICDAFIQENSDPYKNYHYLSLVISAILFMRWYILDAQQHNYRISKAMFLMLVAANALAAPFYFFTTRGKRAWRSIGRALLFLLLCMTMMVLGQGLGILVVSMLHITPIGNRVH